ncbi:hypothetical protein WOLCODRAFT_156405 [Wolfiporia cocos MD-104 SS10]|uniref:Uncharacterized protein n=1 Tax=Wolfiporia cocos (strain MD-104) TaxID=742152 RepID=A0A2H3J0J6_WOLCO|nr:hypothetical protein WOLCODRAFT_156405 [Wolfiporia cocos MD-104 SS10]
MPQQVVGYFGDTAPKIGRTNYIRIGLRIGGIADCHSADKHLDPNNFAFDQARSTARKLGHIRQALTPLDVPPVELLRAPHRRLIAPPSEESLASAAPLRVPPVLLLRRALATRELEQPVELIARRKEGGAIPVHPCAGADVLLGTLYGQLATWFLSALNRRTGGRERRQGTPVEFLCAPHGRLVGQLDFPYWFTEHLPVQAGKQKSPLLNVFMLSQA